MTAPVVQIDYEHVNQTVQRWQSQYERVDSLKATLQSTYKQLQTDWQGQAAQAFFKEMDTQILPAIERLKQTIAEAKSTTLQIAQIFQAAEEEAGRLFRGQAESGVASKPAAAAVSYAEATNDRGGDSVPTPTPTPVADPTTGYTVTDVKQSELSTFFSQYENSSDIPAEVLEKYLTNPQLMAVQRQVLTDLAEYVQQGGKPLNPQEFYAMVLKATGDPGTALLVAHNITKAMSRGLSPIGWEKTDTDPLTYQMDGKTFVFDRANLHPDADSLNSNNEPSIFYAAFDVNSLGKDDPGDWYHYYLEASASYYGASGQLEFDNPGGAFWDYSTAVDGALDGAMNQMKDANLSESPAYQGWRYANSLSYLEGAKYGTDFGAQAEVTREAQLHREGALFGLEVAGSQPDPQWNWYIPRAGAASMPWDTDVDINNDTDATYDPSGTKR